DYWFSTESLTIQEIAQTFSEVLGKKFTAEARSPEQFLQDIRNKYNSIDPYFFGVADFFQQVVDGRMDYIAEVRDDLPKLLGRKGMSAKEWAKLHKDELLKLAA